MKIIINAICIWLFVFSICAQAITGKDKWVALIFDEGPFPGKTEPLLKRLESLEVTATFFPTGQEMERYPEQTQAIIQAGHQLGNHGYSHTNLSQIPLSSAKEEIKKTCRLLQSNGYTSKPMFLPPHGKMSDELGTLLSDHQFKIAHWDIDPTEQLQAGGAQVAADYISQKAKDGSVILLHPMYGQHHQVMEALPLITAQLRQKGFQFATLEQLTLMKAGDHLEPVERDSIN
ncbi:polysaccharide deacetylase family protein [Microbulbifer sp. PAAF003]|uniref:polysaccharide deacetylase family protein n=1 Tax=Microbulbifer sp. PAAF003 TaxID=3243375 RepID=UPI00403A6C7A